MNALAPTDLLASFLPASAPLLLSPQQEHSPLLRGLVPHSSGWALGPKPEERRQRGSKPEGDAEPGHRDGFRQLFREPTGGLRGAPQVC